MGPIKIKEKFNPFPGLRPFLSEESNIFFGREGESEEILSKLLKNRFITIMGASGCGKSSLVYSGVLPRIKKSLSDESGSCKILSFTPGNDPIKNMTNIFTESISVNMNKESAREFIASVLNSNPHGIAAVLKDMIIKDNEKVVIIVDQLEELFSYTPIDAGGISEEKSAAFVTLLKNAISQTAVEIFVLIAIRSDYIVECTNIQGLTQLINNNNFLVPYMRREDLIAAIEGPVKRAGAAVDHQLIEALLDDIGDKTDQLPVLQHALMRTWSHWQELEEPDRPISCTDYNSVGTMSEAMSLHANEVYEELSQRGKEICEKTLKVITKKGADNKGVRHPSSVKSIKSAVQCTSEELFEVIDKFRISSCSFLTPRENIPLAEDSFIDLSCESLVRGWSRLKEWVDEEAASVEMYLRLAEASAMYQQGKATLLRHPDLQLAINWREKHKPTLAWAQRHDPAFERIMVYLRTSEKEYLAEEENKIRQQKKKVKRTRILAMILGGAASISVGFMLFAFVEKIAADRTTNIAENRRLLAERETNKADSISKIAVYEKFLADSVANSARLKEKEAVDQKNIALQNAYQSQKQRSIALEQSDSLRRTAERSRQNEIIATAQKVEARRLRMLSVGKSMTFRSMQMQGQEELQKLLAYQAYLFNKKNGGLPNDADIFQGLYYISKQYDNNVNYKTFTGHKGEIKSVAFVPGKREFYTCGFDGKIIKRNLDSKDQNLQVIYSGTEIIEVLAVSPDAGWLACGEENSNIKMIPINGDNNLQYDLKGHTGKIKSLVFSFDGKYLYSASLDGKVLKWDLAARTSLNLSNNMMQINSIDISSNGNYLAGVSNDGKVLVWNPEKISDNFRIETPGKSIKTIRFKPEDNSLAIGYTDGYVELWDISGRKKISSIKAHTAEVNDIRFNTKLSQMATASNDGTLKLWDTKDLNTPPINFNDNEGFVMVIEFSPDGQLIVSGTYEGIRNLVARPTNADIIAKDMCRILSRNLTTNEWSAYVGKDIDYEKTCPENEFNIKVNVIR